MRKFFLSALAVLGLIYPAWAYLPLLGAGLGAPSGGASLSCSYTPITTATYNVAYTGATPSASGGTPAYSFSNTGSALPTGMSINSSTGVISGTDSTDSGGAVYAGIQVTVTDNVSATANCGTSFTITVGAGGSPMVTPILADWTLIPSNSATSVMAINGGVAGTSLLTSRPVPAIIAGTVGNLKVNFPTTLTQGSWVITLLVNGSAAGSPGNVSCTIDTTHASCADTTNTAAFNANDTLAWQFAESGTPTAQTIMQVSSTITSSTNGQGILFGAWQNSTGKDPSASAANYGQFGGSTTWSSTDALGSSLIAANGTFDGLSISAGTVPGGILTSVFTVFHNGSRTNITCTLTGAASTCNDAIGGGHSFSVSAGDTISLESCPGSIVTNSCVAAGTPATATIRYSIGWIPTISGEALVSLNYVGSLSTSAVRYQILNGGGPASQTAIETNVLQIVPIASTLKKLYVSTDAALSGTQTRTQANRHGTGSGQSTGTLTCALNSTHTTTCNDTANSYSASAGDFINWISTPTNSPPTTADFKIGSVITVP